MPLVVPGVNSAIDKKTEWLEKLKGKKYLEDQESTSATDGNVSFPALPFSLYLLTICNWRRLMMMLCNLQNSLTTLTV